MDGLPLRGLVVAIDVGLPGKELFSFSWGIEDGELLIHRDIDGVVDETDVLIPMLADKVDFLMVALEVGLFGNEKRDLLRVTLEVEPI